MLHLLAWLSVSLFVLALLGRRTDRARIQDLESAVRRVVDAAEAERISLGKALHDGPLQGIHALQTTLQTTLPWSEPTREATTAIARDLRRLSEQLRPPSLDQFGVGTAIETLIDRWRAENPAVDVTVSGLTDPRFERVPQPLRSAAYRTVQVVLAHTPCVAAVSVRVGVTDRFLTLNLEICGHGNVLSPALANALDLIRVRLEVGNGAFHETKKPGIRYISFTLPLVTSSPSPCAT